MIDFVNVAPSLADYARDYIGPHNLAPALAGIAFTWGAICRLF